MAKKKLKKLLKAALIGGAGLLAAKGLGKRRKSVADTAAGEGIKYTPGATIPDIHEGLRSNRYKFDIDHLTTPSLAAKGGRIGKKHGGRTGKQFGGGLGSTARRDMRSGYYPDDMGMRGGPMYEKGGRVGLRSRTFKKGGKAKSKK